MRGSNFVGRIAIAAAVALFITGNALAMHHEVRVASGKQGSYLADAKGMALYTFKKDTAGKSACTGDCVAKWPLFHQEKVGVTGDLDSSDFATITREDGAKQTTHKGMPLYYFVGDAAPGDTKGDGVGDVWVLAKP